MEQNYVIVFQIYLGQFNRSTCNFEEIFEELEIRNDTIMHLSHRNWALRDHQPKVRSDYEEVSRPKITRSLHTQQMVLFFFSKKQLTVAVNPMQSKSGVLRAKSIPY